MSKEKIPKCPTCDLFNQETETCLIICCDNPYQRRCEACPFQKQDPLGFYYCDLMGDAIHERGDCILSDIEYITSVKIYKRFRKRCKKQVGVNEI